MPKLEQLVANMLGESVEDAVQKVSTILAELYQLPPSLPRTVTFATSEQIAQIQKEENVVGHGGSFIRSDGSIVLNAEDSLKAQNGPAHFYGDLGSEFAHFYHRKAGGDNVRGMVEFNCGLVQHTQLESRNGVATLILPGELALGVVIPRAKKEAPDLFCSAYLLTELGMNAGTPKEARRSNLLNRVKYNIDTISLATQTTGDYGRIKDIVSRMIDDCYREGYPISRHQSSAVAKIYYGLCDSLAYWFANEIVASKIGKDVEAFRSFAKTPILPVTSADQTLFKKSLSQVNQYLTEKGSWALCISRF